MPTKSAWSLTAASLLAGCGGSSPPPPQVDIRVQVNCATTVYGHGLRIVGGAPMTCRVWLANQGPDTASDVRVTLLSDPRVGAASVSCTPRPSEQCIAVDGLSFRIPSLPPDANDGNSANWHFVELEYRAPTPVGVVAELSLRATVSAQGDRDPSNNAAEHKVLATFADVSVSAEVVSPTATGQPQFVTVSENRGPGTAEMWRPDVVVPAGFELVVESWCRRKDGSTCSGPGLKYPDEVFPVGERVDWRWSLVGPVTWRDPVPVRVSVRPELNADPNPADNEVLIWVAPPP